MLKKKQALKNEINYTIYNFLSKEANKWKFQLNSFKNLNFIFSLTLYNYKHDYNDYRELFFIFVFERTIEQY